MTRQTNRLRAAIVVTISLTTACSHAPAIEPPVGPPVVDSTTITTPNSLRKSLSKIWTFDSQVDPINYVVILTTQTQQLSPLENRIDTVTSRTEYNISIHRFSDSTFFSGLVEKYDMVLSKEHQSDKGSEIIPPFAFTGVLTPHTAQSRAQSLSSGSTTCSNPGYTVLNTVERTIPRFPIQLTMGESWQDSTTNSTCYGLLPVSVNTIASYRVSGIGVVNGLDAILLDENAKALSSGEGSQDQHRISIQGSTSITRRIYLNPSDGALISSNGTATTSVTVRSSGKDRTYTQTSTESVTQKR
jgi:hypothetical protein